MTGTDVGERPMNDLRKERQARAINQINEAVRRASSGVKKGRNRKKARGMKIIGEYTAETEFTPTNRMHIVCTEAVIKGETIFVFVFTISLNGRESYIELNADAFSFPFDETEVLDCVIETNGLLHTLRGEPAKLLKKIFDMM